MTASISRTRTALLSVYDKEGIVEFAQRLAAHNFQIISSGGTADKLASAGVAVIRLADLVGGGAILGHRVVTLSREVAAGLLATDSPDDQAEMVRLGLAYVDLVCVDLYPLEEQIALSGTTRELVLEKTDIGGPTLLREAAKGERVVIATAEDRQLVLDWLAAGEPNAAEFRRLLGAKAEFIAGRYALISSIYQGQGQYAGMVGTKIAECRYGENAWQTPAALFNTGTTDPLAQPRFKLVAGAPPSYNNYRDLDRLLQTMTHIAAAFQRYGVAVPFSAVAVKHGNACGAAVGDDPEVVLQNMVKGDRRAIFGGLVMTNFPLDARLAGVVLSYNLLSGEKRRLLDGIVAPEFTAGALELLRRRGDKCRFLVNPALQELGETSLDTTPRLVQVRGAFLQQPNYTFVLDFANKDLVWHGPRMPEREIDLLLAWAVGSTSNSNTIALVKDNQLIGNGVGQQDRVSCCQLAIRRAQEAGHDVRGAVAYSDSFFPFDDGPKVLMDAGVVAILTSSGSVQDKAVIAACVDRATLYMIPDSIGRGFFGH